MSELTRTSVETLAMMIREQTASAREVLDAHLERIDQQNPDLNAVVTLDEEGARVRAKDADEALAAGETWGPLHGVPITIKDAIETAGMRTTAGFPPLADHVPDTDATVVARLRTAGAIVVGKSNLPPMALGIHCENPLFGRTHNPWDHTRTPGGSSGGAAAAVAAGLSPLDIGSDLGGSIRLPAHYCGVHGLKPTEHRVSTAGHIPEPPGAPRGVRHLAVLGPLARSAGDLRVALQLIAGPDQRTWEVPPVPLEPAAPPSPKDIRLAWTDDFGGVPVDRRTREVVRTFVATLEEQGCTIDRATPDGVDFEDVWRTFGRLAMAELSSTMPPEQKQAFLDGFAGDSDDPVAQGFTEGMDATMAEFTRTLHARDAIITRVERFLGTWDAWICPVGVGPAVVHEATRSPFQVDGETVPNTLGAMAHLVPFTLTGHPVVTFPVGTSADGLPIGVQVVGRRWEEMRLLALVERLSEIAGGLRYPPSS